MAHESNGTIKNISIDKGVEWIAANDDPDCSDLETVASQVSVILLADLFGKTSMSIARRVLRARSFQAAA